MSLYNEIWKQCARILDLYLDVDLKYAFCI